ncbi:methyltransferase domain-containing protein [Patulibacter minatonensis]|uniref:methyltransferase domain-containing protein n=1 Tax=Patulibacter minatonensis TaxID=298163 RepID=UPI0004BB7D20|nr:methyltransferase domain-containing protein [Patulibacter minatonensis]
MSTTEQPVGSGVRRTDHEDHYFEHVRPELRVRVPLTAARVLDVGCGAGSLGAALKAERPGLRVVGLEGFPEAAAEARTRLDEVLEVDLDAIDGLPHPEGTFDAMIFGDVLEHLRDPQRLLRVLLPHLAPGGVLVCSIPNVKHWSVVHPLLVQDRWTYEDAGLLDRTHVHFFTLEEVGTMLDELGLEAVEIGVNDLAPLPGALTPLVDAAVALGAERDETAARLGAYQYLLTVRRTGEDPRRAAQDDLAERTDASADHVPPRAGRHDATARGLDRHPPGTPPELTIVIPTLDAAGDRLRACVRALQDRTDVPYEIVVVDNGAPPQGFTAPVNAGLRAARGRYAVVCNDDVEVQDGWWPPLRRALDRGEAVAFPWTADGPMREDFAAWCFAVSRDALDRHAVLPGEFLDPALVVWYQDTDLLARLRAAGTPPALVRESQVRHGLSETVASEDPALRAWIAVQVEDDRRAFEARHGTGVPGAAVTS